MPYVDTSVIGGYQPITMPDTDNLLLKALQLRSASGANRLQDLQIDSTQASNDETNSLRSLLKTPGFASLDSAGQRTSVLQAAPIAGQSYLKGMLSMQKDQSDLDTSSTNLALKKKDALDQAVGSLTALGPKVSHQDVINTVLGLINGKVLSPDEAKADLADMPADATQLPGWLAKSQARGLTPQQQVDQSNPQFMQTPQGIVGLSKDGSGGKYVQDTTAGGQAPPAGASPPVMLDQPYVGRQPTGAFSGDPAALYAAVQRISNPADRAGALRALQNQLSGANPTAGPDGSMQGAGATGPVQISGTPGVPPPTRVNGFTQPAGLTQAPSLGIGAGPQGEWKSDALNGGFVYLDKFGQHGQTAGGGPEATLSPAAIENAAARYNLDGTLPPMGMGVAGSMGRKQILDRAAELTSAAGQSGTDARVSQLDAKGAAAALSKLTTQQTAISAFEKTANSNAQLALDMSNKVDRTGIPILNAGLQFARTNSGSPEAAQFHAAVSTFVAEYAKVMSGGTGGPTSDAARAKAASLLTENMTQQQFAAVVKTLQTEMDNRMQGFKQQADELRSQMRGQSASSSGSRVSQTRLDELAAKYGGR